MRTLYSLVHSMGGSRQFEEQEAEMARTVAQALQRIEDHSVETAWDAHHRGRRDATELQQGEYVDRWRVEDREEGHEPLLHAEMRTPGRAWPELSADRPASAPDACPA